MQQARLAYRSWDSEPSDAHNDPEPRPSLLICMVRWILVLPAGVLIGFLATFPLHWALMVSFGGVNPEASIRLSAETLAVWEQTLSRLVIPTASIFGAAWVAPFSRRSVAIVLGVAWMLLNPVLAGISPDNFTWSFGTILTHDLPRLVGVLLGVIAVFKRDADL